MGNRPRVPQGGLSQNVEEKKGMDGWRGKGETEEKGMKPGRLIPLEMGFPLGLATLSKSLLL